MDVAKLLSAGRADCIPKGKRRLWYVSKLRVPFPIQMSNGKMRPSGDYTMLLRWTGATLHTGEGECVMCDDPAELKTHLEAAITAFGDVLVTGLGLACVVRMLQANQRVKSITVVEISQEVIDLVWPHTPHDRVELIHADAAAFLQETERRWDVAWHDVWTDTDKGEPHLQVRHAELMTKCVDLVGRQGAWAFPRHHRRAVERATQ